MEKHRIRPSANSKKMRMSYSRQKEVLEMPNLIEVQKNSYQWFLDEGLKEVFDDISPITDYSGHLSIEFVDFELCEDDVKYSIEKCKDIPKKPLISRLPQDMTWAKARQCFATIMIIPSATTVSQQDPTKQEFISMNNFYAPDCFGFRGLLYFQESGI